ncbi:MAG: TauD/TfdA family dioxygenase [Candidatus Poribacteria bacterium]|nr:TauD/TfdA family dioxygenase [Candidatus Poribacteria bacterium]
MLTAALTDERAWRARTIDDTDFWYYTLSGDCLSAFEAFIQKLRRQPRPITDIRISESLFDSCSECLQPVLAALNAGRGFAIIERVPFERYTVEEAQAMYWVIGQFLGIPFEQNIQGTLLYDVRDTGQRVTEGARFSVTNAESSFHVDNSFGDSIPDFVGLLCLHTAKSGGQSQLISACALHNELLANHPDVLETLYQLFCFDRRGQFEAGQAPTSQYPIFQWDGRELTIRYLYYYIQVGHERARQALNPEQEKALGVLEGLLRRPDFRVEFSLEPGQMLFTNNRWILHNRTAFEDYPDPKRRRHYVRLWLRRKG